MKRNIIFAFIVTCLLFCAYNMSMHAQPLDTKKDFRININSKASLYLGADIQLFFEMFGAIDGKLVEAGDARYICYSWKDIEAYCFYGDSIVVTIKLVSRKYSTTRGISIGDSKDKAIKKYGEPMLLIKNYVYYYSMDDAVWNLVFKINSVTQNIEEIQFAVGD